MACPFIVTILGSYSMPASLRLIQSRQPPLGTALQGDLRGSRGDGCQPTPQSPVKGEGEEAGAGTQVGEEAGVRAWVGEEAGAGAGSSG